MKDMDRDNKEKTSANILVVEDESIVAMEIKNMLKNLGYNVTALASTGEEAIEKSRETQPDLVLMDIKLKGEMDGIEASKHIRKNSGTPIIYLTAYGDDETLRRAKVTEPYGYILKPFEERELKINIKMALYKNKMEKKIFENERNLNNILNSTSEVIISFDKNFRTIIWNKTAEYITGYKQKEVNKKHITKLDVFENSEELIDNLKKIGNGKNPSFNRLVLKTKKGNKKIIQVSNPTIIKDEKNNNIGFVLIGQDITIENEKHGKLITGCSYLIYDKSNKSALNILKNLSRSDFKCFFITRSNIELIKSMIPIKGINIILLTDNESHECKNVSDINNLQNLVKKISKNNDKTVILLSRVDYFITKFSFEKFLETIYHINDIIADTKTLFLLHINPSILDGKQIAIIEDEIQFLPNQQIDDISLGEELYEILKFIYKNDQKGVIVSLKKIRYKLSLTYPTISKRLDVLNKKDLIFIKKIGRLKTVHISEKGKALINKRQII